MPGIRRTRALTAAERQREMLQYLHETTLDIMKQRDLSLLLEIILQRAAHIADTDSGCILLYDKDRTESRVAISIGQAKSFHDWRFPIADGASGEVWRTGLPMISHDYSAWPQSIECVRGLLTAAAYFPLYSNGLAVGVLGVWHTLPDSCFSDETIEYLRQLTALASIAYETTSNHLEAKREIEERRQSAWLQAALYRISEAATSSHDMDELYRNVHRIISRLVPAENFFIALYDAERQAIRYPYYVDQYDTVDPDTYWTIEHSMTEYVLRKGEPVFIQNDDYDRLLSSGEIVVIGARPLDWLGIPLHNSAGAIIGALVVQTYDEGVRYTEQHKDILCFVSDQIATAIERKLTSQALLDSEEKYRAIVESTRDIIFIYSGMKLLFINQVLAETLHYSPQQALTMSPLDFFAEEERERIASYLAARHSEDAPPFAYDVLALRADGTKVPFEVLISKLRFNEQDAFLGIARDISERKLAEQLQNALYRISETASLSANLQELYASVHSIISELVNAENFFIALYDPAADEISSTYYVDQRDAVPLSAEFKGGMTEYVIHSGQPLMAPREKRFDMAKRGLFSLLGSKSTDWIGVPLRSADHKVLGALVVQSYDETTRYTERDLDILNFVSAQVAMAVERKLAEEQLRYLSSHDALTGFHNRSSFEAQLQQQEFDAPLPLTLMICDVDGLKLANDTLGHAAGDQLLRTAALVLNMTFGENRFIARIGGDEFAILLPGIDASAAELYHELLYKAMAQCNESAATIQLSMSVGYAVSNAPTKTLPELFKEADNHMYREKLHRAQSTRSSLVNAMMKLLEARDFITEGHGDRMQDLAVQLAKAAGLPESSIADIRLLAQFHDIGKVGVPDQILFKAGPLLPEESLQMQRHCEIGYRIAQSSCDLLPIADCILKHQEWWNGSGYPLGISGEDIPLACRIISIVDAYDAMTNNRPYRLALPREKALDELRRGAGSQFDPQLVELFLEQLNEPTSIPTPWERD